MKNELCHPNIFEQLKLELYDVLLLYSVSIFTKVKQLRITRTVKSEIKRATEYQFHPLLLPPPRFTHTYTLTPVMYHRLYQSTYTPIHTHALTHKYYEHMDALTYTNQSTQTYICTKAHIGLATHTHTHTETFDW